jgi:hypothetical protein
MSSHSIAIKFPRSSQNVPQVPNVFHKTFPIAPHFLSHFLGLNGWVEPNIPKILVMGESIWLLLGEVKIK